MKNKIKENTEILNRVNEIYERTRSVQTNADNKIDEFIVRIDDLIIVEIIKNINIVKKIYTQKYKTFQVQMHIKMQVKVKK